MENHLEMLSRKDRLKPKLNQAGDPGKQQPDPVDSLVRIKFRHSLILLIFTL